MKGDFSRLSFDQNKRYSAVLMQQGRLQLDSDWNEQVQIAEHRYNAFFRDLVGRSGTPRGDMEMRLVLDEESKSLSLTKGAFYIDGLLIENDSQQDELPVPDEKGDYLYYLDAWTREVNAAEDDTLIDPAVGLETTTRLKTEWEVRYWPVDAEVNALQNTYQKGDWPELSSGDWWRRFSTGTMRIDSLEEIKIKDNCLYRIEVHQDDTESPEHIFKWSRNNASVSAEVVADGNAFTVKNNNTYLENALKGAAWIELCVPGKTGFLVDMSENTGNTFENGILTLVEVPETLQETSRLTICLWDGIFPEVENEKESSLERELGIALTYEPEKFYRNGDYWLILIRDGQIVNWKSGVEKAPNGIEHHFAALGIVAIDAGVVVGEPKSLCVVFDPLTSADLTTESDVGIGGKLGLGFTDTRKFGDKDFPHGRLTLVSNENDGFISFHGLLGTEIGSISYVPQSKDDDGFIHNAALSINDSTGKVLTLRDGTLTVEGNLHVPDTIVERVTVSDSLVVGENSFGEAVGSLSYTSVLVPNDSTYDIDTIDTMSFMINGPEEGGLKFEATKQRYSGGSDYIINRKATLSSAQNIDLDTSRVLTKGQLSFVRRTVTVRSGDDYDLAQVGSIGTSGSANLPSALGDYNTYLPIISGFYCDANEDVNILSCRITSSANKWILKVRASSSSVDIKVQVLFIHTALCYYHS